MKLHIKSDFPEQFKNGSSFLINKKDRITLSDVNLERGLVKINNLSNPQDCKKFTNAKLFTTYEETRKNCHLNKGEYFFFDLEDCKVYEDGKLLGVVKEVERIAVTNYLSIVTDEKLVQSGVSKDLHTIILRPHLIWGPGDNHLLPGIIKRAGKLKQVGRKDDLVDTIYVENAADAHLLASEKLLENPLLSGNIYFVSQDEPISKWKLANAFLDAAGFSPIKGHVSGKTAYMAGAIFESVYKLFNIKKEPPMTRFAAKELATSHWFNISKAKKDLGYYPKVSTKEGLLMLKQWFLTKDL